MKEIREMGSDTYINTNQLEHLKFELINHEHIVTLMDSSGYEIVRGFGNSVIDAINDLHGNLM